MDFRVTGVLSALAGVVFFVLPMGVVFSEPLLDQEFSETDVQSAPPEAAPGSALAEEGADEAVEDAYRQYGASRDAAARAGMPGGGAAGHESSFQSVISLQGNTISTADAPVSADSAALNVLPRFLDLVAPVPRTRGKTRDMNVARPDQSARASGRVISASIMVIGPAVLPEPEIQAPLVAPTPAPRSARPILPVFPASVSMMRSVRDVSGDPLVHVNAPGSWPRRLDQINALALRGQMAGSGQGGHSEFVSSYQQLPEGYVLVSASSSQ